MQDPKMAARFIEVLTGAANTPCTWQACSDGKAWGQPWVLHGPLDQVWPELMRKQREGHGVFVTVSQTDLQGRKGENIVAPRAAWVDADGGATLSDWHLRPAIVVQTRNGQHAYWLLGPDEPVSELKGALQTLAVHYRTDPAVADIARVLRLPGTLHLKGEPFLVKLLEADAAAPRYRIQDLLPSSMAIPDVWPDYLSWNAMRGQIAAHGSTVPLPDFGTTDHMAMRGAFGVWKHAIGELRKEASKTGVEAEIPPFDPVLFAPPPEPVAPARTGPSRPSDGWRPAYVDRAVAGIADEVAAAGQGTRHNTLVSQSFQMGRLVGGGAIDESRAREELARAVDAWGTPRPAWPAHRQEAIDSGLAKGRMDPREPPEDRPMPGRAGGGGGSGGERPPHPADCGEAPPWAGGEDTAAPGACPAVDVAADIQRWASDDAETARLGVMTPDEAGAWITAQAKRVMTIPDQAVRDMAFRTLREGLVNALGKRAPTVAGLRKTGRSGGALGPPPDDGGPVTNFRAVREEGPDGEPVTRRYFVPMSTTVARLHETTDGWPRTIKDLLFAFNRPPDGVLPGGQSLQALGNESELFAWMRHRGVGVVWSAKEVIERGRLGSFSPVSRAELFHGAKFGAPSRYVAAELLPHHPPMPDTFYACGELPSGDGKTLDAFVALFNPETPEDGQLIRAMLVTACWGGEPGTRPGWVITSPHGVGAGKTTTALAVGEVCGGCFKIDPRDDWEKTKERLLSDNALQKRCILIDNIKGKLTSSEFESAITDKTINGKRLYHGDFERPNTLLWMLTVNVAELSRDLADRCVVIQIGPPKHDVDFNAEVEDFLRTRRYALFCDLLAHLRAPIKSPIERANADRFQRWQTQVLGRFPNGNELAKLVKDRRPTVNADASEAQDVADALADLIRERGQCPVHDHVFIPNKELVPALGEMLGCKTSNALKRRLNSMKGDRALRHVEVGRSTNRVARGVVWWRSAVTDLPQQMLGTFKVQMPDEELPQGDGSAGSDGSLYCTHCKRGTLSHDVIDQTLDRGGTQCEKASEPSDVSTADYPTEYL